VGKISRDRCNFTEIFFSRMNLKLANRLMSAKITSFSSRNFCMETNRQPESEEEKLREQLEEFLRYARVLEEVTRAPANLPRAKEIRPVVPQKETFLPGSILTTLFRNPKTNRTISFKREELAELDGMTTEYLLNYYQAQSLFTADDAARLRSSIEAHTRRLFQLMRNSDWRSQVFNYEVAKEKAILRSLLQLRLLVECVQILTPPLMTVKRIENEEFDLIDDLHGLVRLLALVLWQRLATDGTDLQAYGALSLCIAGVAAKADDALSLIESGYAASNADEAAFKKWFEKSGRKAMERVETMLQPVDKHGLDEIFSLFTRHSLDLGLQPVTIEFVRQTLQTLVTTLANIARRILRECKCCAGNKICPSSKPVCTAFFSAIPAPAKPPSRGSWDAFTNRSVCFVAVTLSNATVDGSWPNTSDKPPCARMR
jgi:hypothetical protein